MNGKAGRAEVNPLTPYDRVIRIIYVHWILLHPPRVNSRLVYYYFPDTLRLKKASPATSKASIFLSIPLFRWNLLSRYIKDILSFHRVL